MDERYIWLTHNDKGDEYDIIQTLKKFNQNTAHNNKGSENKTKISVAFVNRLDENVNEVWTSLEQLDLNTASFPEGSCIDLEVLSERIHDVIDSLPTHPCKLHLLWFGGTDWPDIEENVELFGALKRISCWNNANIVFIHSGAEESQQESHDSKHSMMSLWADLLVASCVPVSQLEHDFVLPVWHGSMKLHGDEISAPVSMPGFALRHLDSVIPRNQLVYNDESNDTHNTFTDAVTATSLHFVTSVSIRDIPSFYITAETYELYVPGCGLKSAKAQKLLSPLIDNSQMGFIVRLPFNSEVSDKSSTAARNQSHDNKSRQWADSLLEDISNAHEPIHNVQLSENTCFFHFLLCAGQGRNGRDVIKAHRMRTPDEIDCGIMRKLAELEIRYVRNQSIVDEDKMAALKQCMNNMPHYRAETFIKLEAKIQEAQIQTLQLLIENCKNENKDFVITGGDLLFLLATTRRRCMSKYREKYGDHTIERPEPVRKKLKLDITEDDLEHECDMERKILQYHHHLKERMKRKHTDDHLAGLSPPSKGQVLKLQASELLKFFNSDGTPKDSNLEPLQFKKCRLRKHNSGEVKAMQWPDCSHYKYHDIYYNVGQTPEKTAQKMLRIVERMKGSETVSTCTQQQNNNPSSIKLTKRRKRTHSASPIKTPKRRRTSARRTPTSAEGSAKRLHSKPMRTRKSDSEYLATTTTTTTKRRHRRSDVIPASDTPKSSATVRRKSTDQLIQSVTPQQEKEETTSGVNDNRRRSMSNSDSKEKQSRSARHKQKLEETIKNSLSKHGVMENEVKLYTRCYEKLYKLTFTQVKNLKTSVSLREEMKKIAAEHVEMVVMFERSKVNKPS